MSSAIDRTFNESVLRLQGWLLFLERKAKEYQTQMDRVRRSGGGAPAAEPVAAAPAPVAAPAQSPEDEAGWE